MIIKVVTSSEIHIIYHTEGVFHFLFCFFWTPLGVAHLKITLMIQFSSWPDISLLTLGSPTSMIKPWGWGKMCWWRGLDVVCRGCHYSYNTWLCMVCSHWNTFNTYTLGIESGRSPFSPTPTVGSIGQSWQCLSRDPKVFLRFKIIQVIKNKLEWCGNSVMNLHFGHRHTITEHQLEISCYNTWRN